MRFSRGDVVEYFHDDAMLATMALELADGLRFPLTGILSSTGIPNPPVSVYALAIPFALSSSPAFVIHVIMAWNVVGVALLWFLARRYSGERIALIAGFALRRQSLGGSLQPQNLGARAAYANYTLWLAASASRFLRFTGRASATARSRWRNA